AAGRASAAVAAGLAIAPGDERAELRERDASLERDRSHRERIEGLVDQSLDAALDLVDGAGVDEHGLETGDLGVVAVGPAEVLQPAGGGTRRVRRRHGDQRRELPFAQVVAHWLPGDGGIAEDTQDVVAQLERLTQRQPEPAQRVGELVEASRERGAEVQR